MADQTVICILGMHRSGTSLITRLLNLLGVYLGPKEHLMDPLPSNPSGFWEHELLTYIDSDILARLGGAWDAPPPISSEMLRSPEFADLRRRARTLIDDDFGDVPLWGWKDPRTCLLLPFWQLLLPSMRYVICVRNPLDVTRSLARSEVEHGLASTEHGLDLWLRYTRDALVGTLGQPRLLVFYEDVLRDWRTELRRLAAFVGMEEGIDDAERFADAENVVNPDIAHYRRELSDAVDDPRLSFSAKALHLVLRLVRELERESAEGLPHGTLETFAAAALERGAIAAPGPRKIGDRDRGELGAVVAEVRKAVAKPLEAGPGAETGG